MTDCRERFGGAWLLLSRQWGWSQAVGWRSTLLCQLSGLEVLVGGNLHSGGCGLPQACNNTSIPIAFPVCCQLPFNVRTHQLQNRRGSVCYNLNKCHVSHVSTVIFHSVKRCEKLLIVCNDDSCS